MYLFYINFYYLFFLLGMIQILFDTLVKHGVISKSSLDIFMEKHYIHRGRLNW